MSAESNRRSAVSTAIVMACTLISRLLGFVRTAAISAIFGAGGAADVINLVFNIPNNLRKLLAEGALSTAFIPELTKEVAKEEKGNPKKLASGMIGLQALIILPVLALSLAFPDQVLSIFERFDDPVKRELSSDLFRWMMPYLFFVSVSAVMMAVHNTHDRFFVPAITPIMFSICVIGSLLLFNASLGPIAIGVGVFAGGIAQIVIQSPSYGKLGYSLLPSFDFKDPAFRQVLRRWLPMLITSSLFAVNNQVAMLLASFLPDKSASFLAYAIVFFQLPFGIFSASITTVLYPRMSRQSASKDIEGLNGSLGFGYRNLWALLVPSAMALILLGEPIIAVAFSRRAFTPEDAALTARVLTAYSIGMPFVGLFNITQRAFYASGEVRKPFHCAMATVVVDIGLSLIFINFGARNAVSLALANSLAFLFGAVLQYVLYRRSTGFTLWGEISLSMAKALVGTGAGALVILTGFQILGRSWWAEGSSWSALAILLCFAVIASVVILGLYAWMKVEAVSIILKRRRRKNDD